MTLSKSARSNTIVSISDNTPFFKNKMGELKGNFCRDLTAKKVSGRCNFVYLYIVCSIVPDECKVIVSKLEQLRIYTTRDI